MGSDGVCQPPAGQRSCFNPRSRMGSDAMDSQIAALIPVSIHAPAWGATFSTFAPIMPLSVSIHAPAWGATAANCYTYIPSESFNPRSRMGSDVAPAKRVSYCVWFQSTLPHGERLLFHAGNVVQHTVSIHAPAWGATLSSLLQNTEF